MFQVSSVKFMHLLCRIVLLCPLLWHYPSSMQNHPAAPCPEQSLCTQPVTLCHHRTVPIKRSARNNKRAPGKTSLQAYPSALYII